MLPMLRAVMLSPTPVVVVVVLSMRHPEMAAMADLAS